MFHVNGWVSLAEVARAVKKKHFVARIRRASERLLDGVDPDDPQVDWNIETEIWQICEQASELAALLANGQVVLASKELVDGFSGPENEHVNLYVGTVGSGDTYGRMKSPTKTVLAYGPFLGLPLMLPEICRLQAMGRSPVDGITSLFESPDADEDDQPEPDFEMWTLEPPLDQSPKSVARKIIAMARTKTNFTKAQYRDAFAPDLSVRRFAHAWELAVAEIPSLSNPGQKKRN